MNKYEKMFEQFGITKKNYPLYRDPNSFGRSIKKCTLLKSTSVRYSKDTSQITSEKTEI